MSLRPDRACRRCLAQCAALLAVLAAACASNPAPEGWLPPAKFVPADPYGAWVEIEFDSGDLRQSMAGELLAIQSDSVFVHTYGDVHAAPAHGIRSLRVAWYESSAGALMAWTVVGAASSLSHGGFGVLTLPLWILTGSLATAAQSRSPIVEWDPARVRLTALARYARFPQGFPPDLDRSGLRGKEPGPAESQ